MIQKENKFHVSFSYQERELTQHSVYCLLNATTTLDKKKKSYNNKY